MIRIQRKRITFEILTKAETSLDLDNATQAAIIDAIEQAVRDHVDLRYYPENRYIEERHELLGVGIVEVSE